MLTQHLHHCHLQPSDTCRNFHVSVLRFNNWADTRKPWDFSRCYCQGQRSTIPFHHHLCSEHSLSLQYSNCASDLCQPPTPPGSTFTPSSTGKQTEGGRTHNPESEPEGETLSPNPFTVSDDKSQLQIELRSEITSFPPPPPACRDRSSGLCFLGNKKEHHNSLLASK